MFRYLEALRKKDKGTRKTIAVSTTIALFLIVVGVWVTSLEAVSGSSEQTSQMLSPFTSMKSTLGDILAQAKDSLLFPFVSEPAATSSAQEQGVSATNTAPVVTATGTDMMQKEASTTP